MTDFLFYTNHVFHYQWEFVIPDSVFRLPLAVDLFNDDPSISNLLRLLRVTSALLLQFVAECCWTHDSNAKKSTDILDQKAFVDLHNITS